MSKRARLADFKRRTAYDPSGTQELDGLGRIIAVHPMSDEHTLLEQLGIRPEDCLIVDMYWEFGGDVLFVEIQTSSYSGERPPGVYARRAERGHLNVVIVVSSPMISSTCVTTELRRIASMVGALNSAGLGSKLVPIDT